MRVSRPCLIHCSHLHALLASFLPGCLGRGLDVSAVGRQAALAQAGSVLGSGAEWAVVVGGFHCQGPVISGRRLTWRWFEGALVTSLLVAGVSSVQVFLVPTVHCAGAPACCRGLGRVGAKLSPGQRDPICTRWVFVTTCGNSGTQHCSLPLSVFPLVHKGCKTSPKVAVLLPQRGLWPSEVVQRAWCHLAGDVMVQRSFQAALLCCDRAGVW